MKSKIFKNIFVAGVFLFAISCNSNSEKGTAIKPEEFIKLGAVKENDGKRFSIVGYPYIDGDITIGSDNQTMLGIYQEPDGQGGIIGMLPIDHGNGGNNFYVPENFTMDDFKIYANDGKEYKSSDKMQFSFTMELQTDRELASSGNYFGGPENVRVDKAE